MLRWRIVLGVLFVATLVVLSALEYWLPLRGLAPAGSILLPFSVVVGLAAASEVLWLLAHGGQPVSRPLVLAGTLVVILSNGIPAWLARKGQGDPLGSLGWPCAAFVLVVLAGFAQEIYCYERPGGIMPRLGLGLLGVAYVGLSWSFLMQLRALGPDLFGTWGMAAMLSLPIVVKLGDIGAYTVGRLMGRTKMAPKLSPGKTLEGAVGGLVFACAGAYAALAWLGPWLDGESLVAWPRGWLIYGLAVGAAGMLGDLAESLFKRDVGSKDSSNWMPGFGGVLDLIDSVLYAAPVAYLLWKLQWVGPL